MASSVVRMTKAELEEIIEKSVEHKLLEILGDADEGAEIRQALKERLIRQGKRVAAGERGRSLGEVARKLHLH